MSVAVIVFPGSNCDQDCVRAVEKAGGLAHLVWHQERELPPQTTAVVLPGGFSYGDAQGVGVIAAQANIMPAIRRFADSGGAVLGICNGFQILCEAGVLQGRLLQNDSGLFSGKTVAVTFTNHTNHTNHTNPARLSEEPRGHRQDQKNWVQQFREQFCKNTSLHTHSMHIAHGFGKYSVDLTVLEKLQKQDLIFCRYADGEKVNGSIDGIAGIIGGTHRNIVGMMPHPERSVDVMLGDDAFLVLWRCLLAAH